jgi:pseudouridine synthase
MADLVRLQKFLADAGVCSRRKAEPLIKAGQVLVNGEAVRELGTKVDPEKDHIQIGKKRIRRTTSSTTVVLNKPRGYITSTSKKQGKTVYELLPESTPRLLPVGRLDKDSEGVLLLTNRNELISALTHPRYQHEKHYQVTVSGRLNRVILNALNTTMTIEGLTMSARVTLLRAGADETKQVLSFILTEGKNRQIRRMCESAGLRIHRLVRTQFAGIDAKGLKPGKWRKLTEAERNSLDKR